MLQSAKARIAARPHSRVFYLLADSARNCRAVLVVCISHANNITKYKSIGAVAVFAVAGVVLLATANPGKVHRATPRARRNRRNIAGNKDVWRKSSCVYGIFPYCKQSFRRDVRRNFASGVYTLRRFDELSLPSFVSFLRCTRSSSRFFRCASSPPGLGSFQFERTLCFSSSLATLAYRIRIVLRSLPQRRQLSRYCTMYTNVSVSVLVKSPRRKRARR